MKIPSVAQRYSGSSPQIRTVHGRWPDGISPVRRRRVVLDEPLGLECGEEGTHVPLRVAGIASVKFGNHPVADRRHRHRSRAEQAPHERTHLVEPVQRAVRGGDHQHAVFEDSLRQAGGGGDCGVGCDLQRGLGVMGGAHVWRPAPFHVWRRGERDSPAPVKIAGLDSGGQPRHFGVRQTLTRPLAWTSVVESVYRRCRAAAAR